MYIPSANRVDELQALHTLMQEYSFATLITIDHGRPFATHLPFMLDTTRGAYGTLIGHMARANPQWRHFDPTSEVLTIFQGPHTYISPAWYTQTNAVPTWNYAVVHVYGTPQLIEDEADLYKMLTSLVNLHESDKQPPWSIAWSDSQHKLLKAIVGFEIPITQLEGKFKLSQNRSLDDQSGVSKALHNSSHSDAQLIAQMMLDNIDRATK
jgi:transcriptional regulator